MAAEAVRASILRELRASAREIEAYPHEEDLWRTPPGAPNSGGTLALHLAGNLRHFVGALLGGSGYVRDRDAEFARRNVPRRELVEELERAATDVDAALRSLPEARLDEEYPAPMGGATLTVADALLHLATHLAYHLGQLDYHRRLVTGEAAGVGAVSARELRPAD